MAVQFREHPGVVGSIGFPHLVCLKSRAGCLYLASVDSFAPSLLAGADVNHARGTAEGLPNAGKHAVPRVTFSDSFAATPEAPAVLLKPLLQLSRRCVHGHRSQSSTRTEIYPVGGVLVESTRANRKIWQHRSGVALPQSFFSAILQNQAKRPCGGRRDRRFAST